MITPTIYKYIEEQENIYKTQEMRLGDNWLFNMRDHLQLIYHLKNSIYLTGDNDWMRPFKQVMEPIIELANWTEDIEVKDIVFFIEGENNRVLSFLVKKYHDEVYVKENDVDEFIDSITEQDNTWGGVIVQDTKQGVPDTPSMLNIAFCDQTDILGGAIGFKHFFTPDGLRKMASKGWGNKKNGATITIEELIVLAEQTKETVTDQTKNDVPSKSVEVYVVQGDLPENFLEDNDDMDNWFKQVHVVAFYTDKDSKRHGVTLFRSKQTDDSSLMFFTASPTENRGLGRGVGEKMLHPQIWTNWLSIHKHNFYEAASKVPLVTDDESFTNRNKIQDMENLEVTTVAAGSVVQAIQTASPANVAMLMNGVDEWMESAQFSGAAQDPLLGVEQVSGTTFKGQERTVAQGRGSHDRKRGKRAKFIEMVYRKMIIPQIKRELLKGKKFLATLSADEISWIREQLATNHANNKIKKAMLEGKKVPTGEEQEQLKQIFKEQFASGGNKQLVELLKDDFKDVSIGMGINVANKQKDLVNLSDKILSIFQFVFANPQGFQQAMQVPALAKSFNDILEFSGLNQADFASLIQPPKQELAQPQEKSPQQPLEINTPSNATA